jgi:hypothetical protein
LEKSSIELQPIVICCFSRSPRLWDC